MICYAAAPAYQCGSGSNLATSACFACTLVVTSSVSVKQCPFESSVQTGKDWEGDC